MVAYIKGCDNRAKSQEYIGLDIHIAAAELDELPDGDYYWMQLVGLQVVNLHGDYIGVIKSLFETGANDVMVVADEAGNEHLLPYVMDNTVKAVDLDSQTMTVDWQLEDG